MTNTQKFVRLLHEGGRGSIRGVYGRIVRIKPGQPLALCEEADRLLVLVTGPSGLLKLVGKTGYEMLDSIGYTRKYIRRKLSEGWQFKLLVFARPLDARLATWRNVVFSAAELYPDVACTLIDALPELTQTSFSEFERRSGFIWEDVDKAGPDDERFMTLDRLLASEGTALDVRRFFYHVLRLSDLYTGNGYTKTNDNQRGVQEYAIRTVEVDDLEDCEIVDLDVKIPRKGVVHVIDEDVRKKPRPRVCLGLMRKRKRSR